ncbi:uncharacterized protein F5891DRAFT_1041025 [Suillus fuscotomentosus]|uniref:Secreted protein n=1 Tax=Suillus fuscotomentosus TaxID=1912939 RepID=A0AAD4E3F0_9AGAM|nr:uncharacterized protein F5891DRAFT_1068196 [Suillus fuscotomentosus]XP_041224579.1 uncharacterized protein F5891DRAFT_1041025 [Suillus fuscotomentosus]KAG1892954.1 hypothetical protein F5891DRAFT_1068196 [Suillus fuscotomentosus]KAG1899003.1 hypothetical protein F5891DRAFT_1041025 [Suillus fuscotomentosus]
MVLSVRIQRLRPILLLVVYEVLGTSSRSLFCQCGPVPFSAVVCQVFHNSLRLRSPSQSSSHFHSCNIRVLIAGAGCSMPLVLSGGSSLDGERV